MSSGGLYIKEEEIDAILAQEGTFAAAAVLELPELKPLQDDLRALETHIHDQKADSLRQGMVLRLERVREQFQLSPLDVDALLIGLAPEVDSVYEKLYAYLQDDVTKKRPSVRLVLILGFHPPNGPYPRMIIERGV